MPTPGGYSNLVPNDLKDPTLNRLNTSLQYLYANVNSLVGAQSPVLYSTPTFANAKASNQTSIPTDPTTLLTKGIADQLYGALSTKTALTTGVTAQPVPVESGGGYVTIEPIQTVATAGLYGAHADRPNAGSESTGTFFYETDRTTVYQIQTVGTIPAWIYITGTMRGTVISVDQRPGGLGTNDTGFLFYGTDSFQIYRWSGSGWAIIEQLGSVFYGTHAARSGYTASNYAPGSLYYETDRQVFYINNSGWVFAAGVMSAAYASQPTGLGTADAGFVFIATDTMALYVWTGSAWVDIYSPPSPPGAWTPYTPTVTPSGSMTLSGSTVSGRWQQVGKTVSMRVYIAGTIGGTPSNQFSVALPATGQGTNPQTLACQITDGGGSNVSGQVVMSSTAAVIARYDDANFTAGASFVALIQGQYEAA